MSAKQGEAMERDKYLSIAPDVKLGEGVKLSKFINLYGCSIGDHTKIGAFVEIQKNASVGANCKISSHTFICEGVQIEDNVFIGHSVTFINDSYPRATTEDGALQTEADWKVEVTAHRKGRIHRVGGHHPLQCRRGPRGYGGRGQCSHPERPSPGCGCRQSGKSIAISKCRQEGGRQAMTQKAAIPFLDLVTPHVELEEELTAVFRECIRSAHFIGGSVLEKFEQDFAKFCDARHCLGVANGTDAVRFALIAAGVGPGDVVITVPNTFIATTEAISQAGALPEFVDVDENTSTLDPEKLRTYLEQQCHWEAASGRLVSRRSGRPVRAIVPVHLYGQTADMDPILELAERYHLMVVEDACQAHGAEYFSAKEDRWRKAGSMGRAAAFSFYPGKNLGACGEAGAVTTNDPELARVVSMLRDHGQSRKYYHDIEGYNGRLDALQAGLLHVKLRHLAEWNQKRRQPRRAITNCSARLPKA